MLTEQTIHGKIVCHTNDTHCFFWNGVFSSWYQSPITIDGYTYNCCEQFFMLKKAVVMGDLKVATAIWNCDDPKEQKRLGRHVQNFDARLWNSISRDFMFRAHLAKFTQNPRLKNLLLEQGKRVMVEASPFDTLWGVGMGINDPHIEDPVNWRGKNWLGEILTEVKGILS